MASAADWGGIAPAAGDIGQFDHTISAVNETNLKLGGAVSLDGLTFLGTMNGPVTIAADGNTLTLGTTAGLNMSAANQDVAINCPLKNATGIFNVPGGRTLTLSGGSTAIFNGTSTGLGTLWLNAPSPVVFTCFSAGQIFNIGSPSTGAGGLIIGTNCTVSAPGSFQAGNGGTGLMTINGGILNSGGYVIIGRGAAANVARLLVKNGTINFTGTAALLVGFQNAVGEVDVSGGSVALNGSYVGIDNGATSSGATNVLAISGGLVMVKTVNFGGGFSTSSLGQGRLVMTGGALYVGSGGIILSGTGTFVQSTTLSGGTLGALAAWSSSLPMTLTNDTGNLNIKTADTNGSPFDIVLSGALTGPGGLNKTGAGTLTLSGSNTYSGGTVVSNGTLATTTAGSGAGSYRLATNTTLAVQLAGAGSSLQMSSFTLATGAVLNLDTASFGNLTAPLINVSGSLASASPVVINVSGTGLVSGQFPLIKYGTLDGAGFAAFRLGGATNAISLVNNLSNHSIDLQVNVQTWDGTVNGNWDIGVTANWKGGSVYTETNGGGPAVIFNDAATSSNGAIILNTTVTPAYVVVSNSAVAYSIGGSGKIAGLGGLLKEGSGTLTLRTANTYAGGTTVNAGTLVLGTSNSVPTAYAINGGTLNVGVSAPGTSLAMNSLTFGNASPQLNFDLDNFTNLPAAAIDDSGGLTLSGNVLVNVTNAAVTGNYNVLLQYADRNGAGSFVTGMVPSAAMVVDDKVDKVLLYVPDTNNLPRHILKVYLAGGQSNADGRALTNGLPANLFLPQADVAFYYPALGLTELQPGGTSQIGGFGPELTFGRTLADFFGRTNQVPLSEVRVAILKYAAGGSSLYADWAAGGDASTNGDGPQFIAFQNAVRTGLATFASAYPGWSIELDGMTWVQGESDIDPESTAIAGPYGTNLLRFIRDVRQTYATNAPYGTNLPFFLSRISASQAIYSKPTVAQYPYYLLVRAGQAYAVTALPNVYMINTDGTNFTVKSDNLHFDTGGQQALGTAFAQALISSLPRPQLMPPVESTNGWRVAFTGISGLNYSFQRATSLPGPWSTLASVTLGTNGAAWFYDPAPPAAEAFYRVIYP